MPRRPPQNKDDDEDDISNISDDEYGTQQDASAGGEQRFKYSTADLANDSKRGTACCIIAMCIVCLAVAIAVSIVMAKAFKPDDGNETSGLNPSDQDDGPIFPDFNDRKSEVEDDCSVDNYENPDKCAETCEGFDCCDPFGAVNVSCFHENRQGCINYGSCHVMKGLIDPPADINFSDMCAPENIVSDRNACEELCQSTRCCYDSSSSSCAVDNFWACVNFAHCQHLRDDLQVPMPHEEIDRICDGATTLGLGRDLPSCDEVCAPAACCFDGSCFESDFFTCIHYSPCKNAYDGELAMPPVGELITPPSDQMKAACSGRAIAVNGTGACEQACMEGACCANGGTKDVNGTIFTCFTTDPLGCLLYDLCQDI